MLNFPFKRQGQVSLKRLEELLHQAERLLELSPKEALEPAQSALHLAHQLEQAPALQRSQLLLGRAYFNSGNARLALGHLNALEASALGPRQSTELLLLLGRCHNELGEHPQATQHLVKAVQQAQAAGFSDLHTAALNALAGVYYTQGNYVEALMTLNQAVQLVRVLGQPAQEAKYLNNIGQIFTRLGNYAAALENLLQAYSLIRTSPDHAENEATYLLSIGLVHQKMNNLEVAHGCFRQALEWGRTANNRRVVCVAFNNLANIALLRQDGSVAQTYFQEALELSRELGNKGFEIDNLDGLGQIYRAQAHFDLALQAHRTALQLAQELGDKEGQMDALLNLGRDHLAASQAEAALKPLGEALELAQSVQRLESVYQAHQLLTAAHKTLGDSAAALTHHEAFFEVREQVFEQHNQQQSQMLSAQFALERARHERNLMQQLTQQAQGRLAEQLEALQQTQLELLDVLAVVGHYRHDPQDEHPFRVAEYAAQIAVALGWSSERTELLRQATLLHDLGKIAGADETLSASGLESQQARVGQSLLQHSRSPLLQLAASIAGHHHEHWDGSGVPAGLKGEAIPLEARIVAIADAFDTLTQQHTPEQALAAIKRQSGQLFDPQLVPAATRVLR